MNRMLVTSLLAATQRIVAEIARCQSQISPGEGSESSDNDMLKDAKDQVLCLSADEWVGAREEIRIALRILLMRPDGKAADLTSEWSELKSLLSCGRAELLMTGEISELLASLALNSIGHKIKANNTTESQSSSAGTAIATFVHRSNATWIRSRRSMELSKLNAQLVVEQGRLDSACEERVRLIAQKTKVSATERIGRKMLDFLLEYRAEWDARLLAHKEYLTGLAIESSLCATFLAYGTAFPPAARNVLKRLVYADAISRSLLANPGPGLIECMLPMHDETLLHRLPPERDRNKHFRESALAMVIGSSTSMLVDPHGIAQLWLEAHEGVPDHTYPASSKTNATEAVPAIDGSKKESHDKSAGRGESRHLDEVDIVNSLVTLLPQAGFPSSQSLVSNRRLNSVKLQTAAGVRKPSLSQRSAATAIISANDPGLRAAVLTAAERGRLTLIINITSEEQLADLPSELLLPPALKRLKRPRTIDPESHGDNEEKSPRVIEEERGSDVYRIHPNFRLVLIVRDLTSQLAAWVDSKHGVSVVDFSESAVNEQVLVAALAAERPDLAIELRNLPREAEVTAQRAAIAELDLAEKLIQSTGRIITDPSVFAKMKELRAVLMDATAEVEVLNPCSLYISQYKSLLISNHSHTFQ